MIHKIHKMGSPRKRAIKWPLNGCACVSVVAVVVYVVTSCNASRMPAPIIVNTADMDTLAMPRNFSVTILASQTAQQLDSTNAQNPASSIHQRPD